MLESDLNKINLPPELRAQVPKRDPVAISPERRAELVAWIDATLPVLRAERGRKSSKVEKYRETLRGQRALPSPRPGASNLSVPLTSWAASGSRNRLDESLFRVRPVLVVAPTATSNAVEMQALAKELSRFLENELLNPEGLNGRRTGKKVIADFVNAGTCALKVYTEAPVVRRTGPGKDNVVVSPGRPKFEYIAFDDLIYWQGFGQDTQKMPYVGHEFDLTWSDILMRVALGDYEAPAVSRVKEFYNRPNDRVGDVAHPVALRSHRVAELYLDFVIDDSGIPASLVVDFHPEAHEIVRIDWNPTPGAVRPVLMSVFEEDPDPTRADGIGVPQKLDGAQDEADEVHNIAIESAKRAGVHIIGLRTGSAAADEFGGAKTILPGDLYVTEDLETDLKVTALGDATAAQFLIALEEHTRMYVMRLFGRDEASLGNVESGKRVPASLGMSTMREGKVDLRAAGSALSELFESGMYIAVELLKRTMTQETLRTQLSPDAADKLMATVFDPLAPPFKNTFAVTIHAQDAASIEEERKMELVMLTQFLMSFYDKVLGYMQIALTMPEPLRPILTTVLSKLENSVKLLMTHVESIPNPSEVIPDVAAMIEGLSQIGGTLGGAVGGGASDSTNGVPNQLPGGTAGAGIV